MAGIDHTRRANSRGYSPAVKQRWGAIHVVSLVVVLAVLVFVCRGQWFFGDEWDFLLLRGLRHSQYGLLRPHNEHWSTIPILWYRAVFSVVGVKTYWPYLFGLFAVHLVVVHSGWRIMRRVGVHPAVAAGAALVMGLFGAGSENLTWAFQVGFVGSLAAGMVLMLAVDDEGKRSRVGLVAAGAVAALMFSGISVVMVGAVGLTAFAHWGWRRALAVVAPAGVAYVAWLKLYGSVGLHGGNAQYHGGLKDVPRYVWGGLSDTLGEPLHSRRVGEALLVVLIVVVVARGWRWWREAPDVLALAAAAPVMFAVISQGRGALQDPSASRYLYLCAGMLVPLIGYAVHTAVVKRPAAIAVALVGCLAVTASGAGQLRDHARFERTRELALKGQILAAVQVERGEPIVTDLPDYTYSPELRVDGLRRLDAKHRLPPLLFDARDLAAARLALQVVVLNAGEPGFGGEPLAGAHADVPAGATLRPVGNSCDEVDLGTATLVVRTEPNGANGTNPPARFTVRPSSADVIEAFVPAPAGTVGPHRFPVAANETVEVHQAVAGVAEYHLPTGPNLVCGLAWNAP